MYIYIDRGGAYNMTKIEPWAAVLIIKWRRSLKGINRRVCVKAKKPTAVDFVATAVLSLHRQWTLLRDPIDKEVV